MTDLLLVRHGRTQWNELGRLQGREDIPLDDVGTAQAAAAAQTLAAERWDAVVSSPLGRALGTAELIAAACGLPEPTTDADLVERHYGQAGGLFDHEVTARGRTGCCPVARAAWRCSSAHFRRWNACERLIRTAGWSSCRTAG